MDPVPITIAAAVATALVAAVLALWRKQGTNDKRQDDRNRKCEERGEKLEAEVIATKALVIDIYRERAKDAESRAEASARRELQMAETARVCAKVLKRYENAPVPPESSGGTSALQRTVRCLAFLAFLILTGCAKDRAVANSAATIWEAADATEKGANPAQTMPAIKANAAAIIRSTGSTYAPAGVTP